jgi:hypothetical protein
LDLAVDLLAHLHDPVGTEVKAEINDSGKFVLEGVPMGNVELKFEGGGVEAKIEIRGGNPNTFS